MYDQNSQKRLRDKLDYELWLLDFLSNTEEIFTGGTNISTITLINKQQATHVSIEVTDVLGSGKALEIMNKMMPLTFVASYKILDMIFEWILEENYAVGNIKNERAPSQWKFSEKIRKLRELQLSYPPLMLSESYIKDYLFALYDKLLDFRNEIVHRNNFSVSDSKLRVTAKERTLDLDRSELGAFVRIVVCVAKLLTGDLPWSPHIDRLLKYHLDRIQKLHCLNEFKQKEPLIVNVILKVPIEGEIFPADLKFVREKISQIYPNADVRFNLKIIGLKNGKPCIGWNLPADAVPEEDLLELRSDSLKEYRLTSSEL